MVFLAQQAESEFALAVRLREYAEVASVDGGSLTCFCF